MKRLALLVLIMCLSATCVAEGVFSYRFADADEAAELLLSNREYFENLSQNDLNYRMQKQGATLLELENFAAQQTRSFTDEEKAVIDAAMQYIEQICASRGYALPLTEDIVFAKTTMHEECEAGGYTHGTQIYLGEAVTGYGMSEDEEAKRFFLKIIFHELFHSITRNHPEFRRAMYAILGFTVQDEDFPIPDFVRQVMISNPDVEHHNAYAAFDIGGELKNCVVVFTSEPFEKAGDSFFRGMQTGLLPIDDPDTMYSSGDAANFWEVFGENTSYVIDPEETLADNFSLLILHGLEYDYETPEIIEAIDAYLRGEAVEAA